MGGKDRGMEMGVDSRSKEEDGLKYFIRELLLLSILVFEKFMLRGMLNAYDFVRTQGQVLNLICSFSLSLSSYSLN